MQVRTKDKSCKGRSSNRISRHGISTMKIMLGGLASLIASASLLPTPVKSKPLSYPKIRGDYLVCGNNQTVPLEYFRFLWTDFGKSFNPRSLSLTNHPWDLNTLKYKESASRLKFIESEIIVGKEASKYDRETIDRLKKKMLYEGISVPTSYKSTSISPSGKTLHESIWSWIYKFRNQQGKTLRLERIFGSYTQVTDNSNQKFEAELSTRQIGMMYCTSNALHIRSVSELKLKGIQNEYGESIRLPLMFWLVDAAVKTKRPSSYNKYDF